MSKLQPWNSRPYFALRPLSFAAILAASIAACVPRQVPDEGAQGDTKTGESATKKQRTALTFESLQECGVGKSGSYEKTVVQKKAETDDWGRHEYDSPNESKATHANLIGGRWFKREGTKASWNTMYVRYERTYTRIRGGKIDRRHSTNNGECLVNSLFDGSSTIKQLQPCLGIKDAEAIADIHVCARPDGPRVLFWEPMIDFEAVWSGKGIPEEDVESCGGVGYRSDSHLSFSPDPDQNPVYRFGYSRDDRWDRDEKSCEQYAITAEGPISLLFQGKTKRLSAKEVVFNEGPLYFHNCGKSMVVPDELRKIVREGVATIDPELDGIYMLMDGWEPITNFYEIPEGGESYSKWMCMRKSTSKETNWWPW